MSNETYELFGSILYNTPADEITNAIQSDNFARAKRIANRLLSTKNWVLRRKILLEITEELRNYMNSPLIDFLCTHMHSKTQGAMIIHAIANDSFVAIRYLINGKYAFDKYQRAFVRQIAKYGRMEILAYLEKYKLDIKKYNKVAFETACQYNQLDIIKYLHQLSAINVNSEYYSIGLADSLFCSFDIFKYLCENIKELTINDIEPQFFRLCIEGRIDVINYICKKINNIFTDDRFPYAIIKACQSPNPIETIECLTSNGFSIRHTFANGGSFDPLSEAIWHNDIVLIKYLLDKWVTVRPVDIIESAKWINVELETHKYIVERSNIPITDRCFENALIVSITYRRTFIARYLIELGVKQPTDNYILNFSSHYDDLDFIKFLVEHGALANYDGTVAIQRACKCGHVEIVKYLLEAGVKSEYASYWLAETALGKN